MFDREVTMGCVLTYLAWAGSGLLLLTGTVSILMADSIDSGVFVTGLALLAHALMGSAVAATCSIHQMLVRQRRFMRDAFDMGRDIAARRIGT